MTNTLVVIPCFQESENLKLLIPEIMKQDPELELLIVDDFSNDGTDGLILKLSLNFPNRIHYSKRTFDPSYAQSLLYGINFSIKNKFNNVIVMDADGSHSPVMIPKMLNLNEDLVIGSRYLGGSKIEKFPLNRQVISKLANLCIRFVLKLPYSDNTNSFRLYRGLALESLHTFVLKSKGFAIQYELLLHIYRNCPKLIYREIPITFRYREIGNSKFNLKKLLEAFLMLIRISRM